MTESSKSSPTNESYIDLLDLSKVLYKNKIKIGIICFIFFFIGIFYSLSLPNIYKSETILTTSEPINSAFGNLGGLASLAGFGLDMQTDKASIAIEKLKSMSFFERFIEKYNVLVPLHATKYWDPDSKELIIDNTIYDSSAKKWLLEGGLNLQNSFSKFHSHVNIFKSSRTGFVTIEVKHQSPYVAQDWSDNLVKEINDVQRKSDMDKASQSIEYLKNEIRKTQLIGVKTSLNNLIEEQLKTVMVAKSNSEYVFEVLSNAYPNEKKFEPNRFAISFIFLIVSFIFSSLFFIIRKYTYSA